MSSEDSNQNPNSLSLPLPGGIPLELMPIPAGSFRMGSRDGDNSEQPVHTVKISDGFYLGRFPITQEQYAVVDPQHENWFGKEQKGVGFEKHPAEQVSWDDAVAYCKALNGWIDKGTLVLPEGLKGYRFRLPTEAEWEYACRAPSADSGRGGTETEYWNGDGEAALAEVGWYDKNSGQTTHRVGEKGQYNAWGLSDMHGNVWEWCLDEWSSSTYRERLDGICNPKMTGAKREITVEMRLADALYSFWEGGGDFKSLSEEQQGWLGKLTKYADGQVKEAGADAGFWRGFLEILEKLGRRSTEQERMGQIQELGGYADALRKGWGSATSGDERTNRLIRGGSWNVVAWNCRSSYRDRFRPDNRNLSFGFRVGLFSTSASSAQAGPQPAITARASGRGAKPRQRPRWIGAHDEAKAPQGSPSSAENDPAVPDGQNWDDFSFPRRSDEP